MDQNRDIQDLISETEHAEIVALSQQIDDQSKTYELVSFIARNAGILVELLEELKERRESEGSGTDGRDLLEKHARVIVDGFSDESAAAALSDALNKASHYFSELLDISMTLRQLSELAGGGHRAVLELHITPLNNKNRSHVQGLDIENKKARNKEFRNMVAHEAVHGRHLIFDHFVKKVGMANATLIPEYMMINIGDAKLMHHMIEHDFFKAGRKEKKSSIFPPRIFPSPVPPPYFMVRYLGEDEDDDNDAKTPIPHPA